MSQAMISITRYFLLRLDFLFTKSILQLCPLMSCFVYAECFIDFLYLAAAQPVQQALESIVSCDSS